jgi:hypothetical protein
MTLRFSLPKWLLPSEIGLGEVVKRGTAAVGVKPCAGCLKRAGQLDRVLVFAPAKTQGLRPAPTLTMLPAQGVAADAGAILAARRQGESDVVHLPEDEGTPDSDTGRCCTYSVTLISKSRPKPSGWLSWLWSLFWPWLQPAKVRVTATGGTTILNADPDEWQQAANFPNSVTWDPGTLGPIAPGDATDSWIIDNDFLLSLGPVGSGVKTITIEWLTAAGFVTDAFAINIPCLIGGKEDDSETAWEQYTSVTKGGTYASVYLEPDDCDPGDFDYRADCILPQPTCTCGNLNGQNAYLVTYAAPSSPPCSSYQWTINGSLQSSQTANLTVLLAPGSYDVGMSGFDSNGNTLIDCGISSNFLSPLPDFTWTVDSATKIVTLDASPTENSNVVVQWEWTCSNPAVAIAPGMTSTADLSALPDGPYMFTLQVTDNCGCKWEQNYTFSVGGCVSTWQPSYSWCVAKIDPGLQADVTVTFTSMPGGSAPYTYAWSFDDSNATSTNPNTSTLANPTHTYMKASHGFTCNPSLTVTDQYGCRYTAKITLKIGQREPPNFSVKVCPDGKVVCETNESHPVWTANGPYNIAPWPYTKPKKHRTRIIYFYQSAGIYSVALTDTNDDGNMCTSEQRFTIQLDCCRALAHARLTSNPLTVQVNNKTTTLRIKGKLRQKQGPLWHRVIAKTILQKQNPSGHWYRYRSNYVIIGASFGVNVPSSVYRSEWNPLAFDGSFFIGCRCYIKDPTAGNKQNFNKRKVRAVDGLAHHYTSRFHSITSEHLVEVNGNYYTLVNLSLCNG